MIGILLSVAATTAVPQVTGGHIWHLYRNERFGTVAQYPSDLFRYVTYPDNGDGVSLQSAQGATLLIFAGWNIGNQTPAAYEKSLAKSDGRYRNVTYRIIRRKLLVMSGIDNGQIFYERYDFADPANAIHAIVIRYPTSVRAIYDPIIPRLSASLKWTHPLR